MSIAIDTNIYSLGQRLNITSERMQNYTNKSIDEIIESESAQGNQNAINFQRELRNKPDLFIETFELNDPSNKFNIFSSLQEIEQMELLNYLEEDDLRLGLYFFTQENILALMQKYASIEEIVNATLMCFKLEKVMKMMPDEELNKFVLNKELDPDFLRAHLAKMPPETLAIMIEAATGEPVFEENPYMLVEKLYGLDDESYKEALIAMNPDDKRVMVMNMYQDDEKVLQLFPGESYLMMLYTLDKEDMMPCVNALQKETLVNMNSNLPQELMATVLTQMDTKEMARLIINDYPQVMHQLLA
ncbi:hypothetical protein IJG72_06895 [bacterium]|nr:hypothetical protein [bacterium]